MPLPSTGTQLNRTCRNPEVASKNRVEDILLYSLWLQEAILQQREQSHQLTSMVGWLVTPYSISKAAAQSLHYTGVLGCLCWGAAACRHASMQHTEGCCFNGEQLWLRYSS